MAWTFKSLLACLLRVAAPRRGGHFNAHRVAAPRREAAFVLYTKRFLHFTDSRVFNNLAGTFNKLLSTFRKISENTKTCCIGLASLHALHGLWCWCRCGLLRILHRLQRFHGFHGHHDGECKSKVTCGKFQISQDAFEPKWLRMSVLLGSTERHHFTSKQYRTSYHANRLMQSSQYCKSYH